MKSSGFPDKHPRIAAFLLSVELAVFSLLPSAAPEAGDNFPELPIEIIGRVIFVKGTVNEKGPLNFILDTGATETVLTLPTAERAGLRVPGNTEKKKAVVESVIIGNAVARNLIVYVFDPPQALSLRLDKGIDYHGILGYTFLSRYVTTIDFRRKKVKFVPIVLYQKRNNKLPAGTSVVSFQVHDSLILAPASIGRKRPVSFLVDTGSAEVLLLPDIAAALKVPSTPLPGYENVRQTALEYITLGGATVSNVTTIVTTPSQDRHSKIPYEGILGHPFLSSFIVTVNYRDKELTLTPCTDAATDNAR